MTSSTPLTDAIVAKYIGQGLSGQEFNELLDHARSLDECLAILGGLFDARGCERLHYDGARTIRPEWIERARALLVKARGEA